MNREEMAECFQPRSSMAGKHKRQKTESLLGFPPAWQIHWGGMPSCVNRHMMPHQTLRVHFRCPEDREEFARMIGQKIGTETRSVWYPSTDTKIEINNEFVAEENLLPKYPVYVISKGRWESRLTVRALERIGVPHRVVIEPQERDQYASVMDPNKLLILPFSNLGQGSIPVRNWVWEHAISEGAKRHWILDDNIRCFRRYWKNRKIKVKCGNIFKAAEDFVDRYENVGLAGFQYAMFCIRKENYTPFFLNTRIYSCILIDNSIKHRWRGRYNEDTDLSLRVLKDEMCTVLFYSFLAEKSATMTMKGGNTDELYKDDGRLKMAESLKEQHPDVVEITHRWGRWQHVVDYSPFKRNKLKLKRGVHIPEEMDEYGMYLKEGSKENLLMIGQAPGRKGDAGDPLGGRNAKRLAKLAGLSYDQFMGQTDRVNMFDEWFGKEGKGDAWDHEIAMERASQMKHDLSGRRVVFVGKNVARAFGEDMDFLEWKYSNELDAEIAVIPHPSGIVQWWNDRDNRKAAGEFLAASFEKQRSNDESQS